MTRDGKKVDAVAQITKTGHVFVLDRMTGAPLFPIEQRKMPAAVLDGERTSPTQPFPVLPPPFARQRLTEDQLTDRTPSAHAAALKTFNEYRTNDPFDPPNTRGTIIFPGVDGGGEWGGPAFDPETGLLYVNSNEMAWLLKMVPRSDKSLYGSTCASCHGDDRKGTSAGPSLIGVGDRKPKDQIAQIIREGTGRMSAFGGMYDNATINDPVNFLITGKDIAATAATNPFYLKYRNVGFDIFLDDEGYPGIKPPWGTLNAIDLNSGAIRWKIPFGEYPKLAAQGIKGTGTRQLRRRDRHAERVASHRRNDVRQQVPRLRQAHRQTIMGSNPSRRGQRDAVNLCGEGEAVSRHRVRWREEWRAERRDLRGVCTARRRATIARRAHHPVTGRLRSRTPRPHSSARRTPPTG